MLTLKVKINTKDTAQLKLAQDFLEAIQELNDEVPGPAPEKETKKKPTTASKAKAAQKAKQKATEPEEPEDSSDGGEESDYTINDVRALLAKKVKSNRAAIKKKLNELDVKNVTTMEESDYPEFMEFLEGLED